jgi:type I restriction enzyme M protein
MLDAETKRHIDNARDVLVGKVPDPKAQIEMITIALIYKFMDDMDKASVEMGGKPSFFTGQYKEYTWTKLMDIKMSGVQRIKLYSEALEKMPENKNLPQLFRDILKDAYLPFRDPETLNLFLKEIAWFDYEHSENLGNAFEYLLSIMSSQGDAGQFRTPRHIIDFMVDVISPEKNETILDPACGTAGFLISAYNHILTKNTKKNKGDKLSPEDRKKLSDNIVGYDISPDMVRLSRVNLYLHGFKTPKIYEYDTLTSEDRWNDNFDVILANPPFMTPKGGIRPHKKFAIQANRSEVLFVDYIAEHINLKGRAAVIVPEGIIFQSANAYKALRKKLVEENYLWAVVSLPAGIFNPYSGVKTSILFMDREIAKKVKDVLFVKISNDGFDLGAQRREIAENDLHSAVVAMNSYIETVHMGRPLSKIVKKNLICEAVPKVKLAESGEYNLSCERYKVMEARENQKWPVVNLGEICEVIAGQSPEGEFYNEKGNGTPFYQGKTDFTEKYLGEPTNWTTKETKIAEKNDILMSVRAPVGPVNIATQRICIGRGLAAIRSTDRVLMPYVFSILKNMEKDIKGNGGAVFDSINKNAIEAIKIPLPSVETQREIVAEIEGYQKIIDGARMVVDNWKPRIDIDPTWPTVKMEEVCEITSSKRIFQEEYVSSGVPFYRTKEIVELSNNKEISLELYISEKRFNEIERKFGAPQKDDILISAVGTIGVSWVVSDNRKFYFKDGNLIWLKSFKKANPNFIKTILDFYVATNLHLLTNGAAYSAMTIIKLKELLIPLPSEVEQQVVVETIKAEQKSVNSCREMIKIYEDKIKQVIDKVWG